MQVYTETVSYNMIPLPEESPGRLDFISSIKKLSIISKTAGGLFSLSSNTSHSISEITLHSLMLEIKSNSPLD